MSGRLSHPLLRDQRGTVMVEYTVLLVLVALGCAAATFALGPPFAAWTRVQIFCLLMPPIF